MDLKVIFIVVCLSSMAIISTDAGIPKCCIRTREIHPKRIMKMERWERQYSTGACDIDALVVYIKGLRTPLCVHPKWEKRLKKLLSAMKTLRQNNLGKY
ncbi:hypothetical protein CHARACLAT_002120 [Characodon lateralis]|uniref:Chemokine interleukin-8-like domain-containing protein n=1 Tax=Characodon lateralis TaxID=208331 RepID=A0ABU7DMM8_9TELE|nr:hypothetical protein [Characodon lateralis]